MNLGEVDTGAGYLWRANAKSDNKLAASGSGTDVQNIIIQDRDLHSDGKLDILSYATQGNNDDILGYDFLLDEAVSPNGSYSYDLALNRSASIINWSRTAGSLDSQGSYYIRLYGERKEKLYSFTPFQRPTDVNYPLQASGELTMLPEFPADRYLLELYGYEPNSDYSFSYGYRYYPYPPQNLELVEPGFRISAGRFSGGMFSWSYSGAADLTILKMTPPGCSLSNFNWYVWMDGQLNNWSLIEVPAEIRSCISTASIRNAIGGYNGVPSYIDRFYVQRQDVDVVPNYDAMWSLLSSGVDLEEMALQRTYVRHSFYSHEDAP